MSYSCNANCFFCYNPYRNSPINYKTIEKIVRNVKKAEIPHVYLIGGEPSLLKITELNKYIDILSEKSSVTIVTNGLKYMEGLSNKLACLGVAIHGNRETQEWISGVKGGYSKTIKNIKKYVREGFDVRCIPVLTSKNYDQIYNIIKLAKKLGMESVFVDKFEIGGMGLEMASQLKPSLKQFQEGLTQMIKARDIYKIPVGFGTAIPYCLDKRLITEEMFANCGVGVTFAAINPNGDFRICNQSEIVYGNVLKEPIEKIWNKKELDEFRDLRWTTNPCSDCELVTECSGGCKVDLSCSSSYCIDYHIRENLNKLVDKQEITKLWKKREEKFNKNIEKTTYPKNYRTFSANKYLKLITKHKEKYLVTRYQTILIDEVSVRVIKEILSGVTKEKKLIEIFKNEIAQKELRKFLSKLERAGAINVQKIKTVDWEITKDCNLKCKHCIVSAPQRIKAFTTEQVIRAIGKLKENGLEEISFTGGEPLTLPDLKDILIFCKSQNITVRILTNGTLLTKETSQELSNLISEIGISLDGTDIESNDLIRGKGSFKKILDGIENIKREKKPFSLYFTLHKSNKDIEKMTTFAKKLGAQSCRINQVTKRGRATKDYTKYYDVTFKIPDTQYDERCSVCSSHLFINPNGDCFPCVEISQIEGKPLGNIFDDNIDEIHKKVEGFIKRNEKKKCPYNVYVKEYETICLDKNLKCKAQ